MDDVAVVAPWRPSPDREPLLGYVAAWWQTRGVDVTLAAGPENGPWVKAAAVNPAVARTAAEVVVVTDADVISDGTIPAVDAVRQGAAWAVPHWEVRRLNRRATRLVLDGAEPSEFGQGRGFAEAPYAGVVGGGIVVARRDVLVDCPLDPRFEGWGDEDSAWGWALTTLHGPPARPKAVLWHLWHEPQQREHRKFGSQDGLALRRRYRAALGRPEVMRRLIGEAQETSAGG